MGEESDLLVEETGMEAEENTSVAAAVVVVGAGALAVEVISTVLCSRQLGVEEVVAGEGTPPSLVYALAVLALVVLAWVVLASAALASAALAWEVLAWARLALVKLREK